MLCLCLICFTKIQNLYVELIHENMLLFWFPYPNSSVPNSYRLWNISLTRDRSRNWTSCTWRMRRAWRSCTNALIPRSFLSSSGERTVLCTTMRSTPSWCCKKISKHQASGKMTRKLLTMLSMGPWFLMLHLSRRYLLLKPVEYEPNMMGAIQNALMEELEKLNSNSLFTVNRNRGNNRWDITCP